MTYQIEITRFVPEPIKAEHRVDTPDAASQPLQLDGATSFVAFVAALDLERHVDWGNFYLSCNGDRALVVLHEHCEHTATDPDLMPGAGPDVLFHDGDGISFSVPFHQTVTPAQGLAALSSWLPNQKQTPALKWY